MRRRIAEAFKAHGAVWISGFRCGVKDFETLSDAMSDNVIIHQSRLRRQIDKKGKTTTVTTGVGDFALHRERAMLPAAPDILFFLCVRPADTGGRTLVCDGVKLFDALEPRTQRFLRTHRTAHEILLAPPAWSKVFQTNSLSRALDGLRALAARMGPEEDATFRVEGKNIRSRYLCPLAWKTKYGGQEAFCHEILLFLNNAGNRANYYANFPRFRAQLRARGLSTTRMEDGSAFPLRVFNELKRKSDALVTGVEWAAGDIVMVDNSRMLHGREGFTGPREVLFRMSHSNLD